MPQKKETTHPRKWTTAKRLIDTGALAPFEITQWFVAGGPVYDGRTGEQLCNDDYGDLARLQRLLFGRGSRVVSATEEMAKLALFKGENYQAKDPVVLPPEPPMPHLVYLRSRDVEPFVATAMHAAGHTYLEIFCALFPDEYHKPDGIQPDSMTKRIARILKEAKNSVPSEKENEPACTEREQYWRDKYAEVQKATKS